MNKAYFTILILMLSIKVSSQVQVDSINETIIIDQVNEVQGSAKELKDKAFEWIAKSYNNSNHVTKLNSDNKIITKGFFDVSGHKSTLDFASDAENVSYLLELSFKDGRYRTEIKNVTSLEIKFSLMNKLQYKNWLIDFYSKYEGQGKKFALKKINDEKYLNKVYKANQANNQPILKTVIQQMEAINANLLQYMNTVSDDDDW